MFHDIHSNKPLESELAEQGVLGAAFNEIVFADDTIFFATNARTLEKLLHRVDNDGEKYGANDGANEGEPVCDTDGGNDAGKDGLRRGGSDGAEL